MIYLDVAGRGPGLVPPAEAMIPATDRGFLYGDGLFETLLAMDGALPLLPLHLERLSASAAALGIPCAVEAIARAARAVASSAGRGEHALRITLSRGTASKRGYEPPPDAAPTVLVTSSPYTRPTRPLRAVTASVRVNPDSPLVLHKALSALEWVMARAEAARAGADEALLLNAGGRVAQGAASNLFICREGRWLTPPVAEGCLPGVMRRRAIALTGAGEAPITVQDLFTADGVFLTSALMGCIALGSLDGAPLPQGGTPLVPGALFTPG